VNIRGPFGEQVPGKFGLVAQGIINRETDRPEVTHRGVKVMRHDEHDLTQVDDYPDATSWYIDDNGQLDVHNEDCTAHVVASYPAGCWRRVWFPGAEEKARYVPSLPGEDENGEFDDVEPDPS
jgi:hypothetical protein